MSSDKRNEEVITFKVDRELMELLRDMPNRSEFIRQAISRALDNVCPLCNGSGHLSPRQKQHMSEFFATHRLTRCPECHEVHILCDSPEDEP